MRLIRFHWFTRRVFSVFVGRVGGSARAAGRWARDEEAGFRDAGAPARRLAADGYLGADDSRLVVEVEPEHAAAGFVNWRPSGYGVAKYWEIGIALLPEWRGRGIGWRAQAMLCDYLFHHTPAERIEARTHVENIAEQKALEKAGFRQEGLLRSAEVRAGRWRDGWIYSRLRGERSPL